mmetsp:Transcript_23839/g.32660  ORF Transcript_23839/g.32660 Transcript_23839/m.32660 type:complete len:421 (-) Transcript_23839:26-1288(-)
MKNSAIISRLISFTIIQLLITKSSTLSPFTCKGKNYNITKHDNDEMSKNFQRWLYWRQNNPQRCGIGKVETNTQYGFGLGASIAESVKKMIQSIEMGNIYRPHTSWLWSEDQYPENCTLKIKSIDCYSLPISECVNLNKEYKIRSYEYPQSYAKIYKNLTGAELIAEDRDICDMGAMVFKPTIWVLGQLFLYHMRPTPSIQNEIDTRVQKALKLMNNTKNGQSLSLALHIRSGMDSFEHAKHGRKTLPMSRYIAVIDRIQEELQMQGKSLGVVYLCSHVPAMSYISLEHMTTTYPRPFRYSILPRIDTGSEETEIKIFRNIAKPDGTPLPPLRELYIEYLTDLYVAMEADIYLGAYSNVYALAGSMRMAKYPMRPLNHTCFLDIHFDPPPLKCEGTSEVHGFWRWIGSGGFDETISFFTD